MPPHQHSRSQANSTPATPSTAFAPSSAFAPRPIYYRILFPHLLSFSRDATPPPVTSSSPAIDAELYTLIAYVIRDFIFAWYHHISLDQEFALDIVGVIVEVVRKLEARLGKIDFIALLLVDAPHLLHQHYLDFRSARAKYGTNLGGASTIPELFHGSQPHFALSTPEKEEEYLRIMSDQLLKLLLPEEEYESECVRLLVREILGNLVLANVVEKLSDPYMINTIIWKLLAFVDEKPSDSVWDEDGVIVVKKDESAQNGSPPLPPSRSSPKKSLTNTDTSPRISSLLQETQPTNVPSSPPSVVRSRLSKSKKNPPPSVATAPQKTPSSPIKSPTSTAPPTPTSIFSLPTRAPTPAPADPIAPDSTPPPPPTKPTCISFRYLTFEVLLLQLHSLWTQLITLLFASQERFAEFNAMHRESRHVRLEAPLVHLMAEIWRVDRRGNAWVWEQARLFIVPVVRALGGGFIDKLLEYSIHILLGEDRLVYYLQLARETLWPGGQFMPPGEEVTEEEKLERRKEAERRLVMAMPGPLKLLLLGTSDDSQHFRAARDALEPLQLAECNRHLVLQMLDLVVARMCPELVAGEVGEQVKI